jgi:arylsulfatase A-like enzyme
MRRPGNVLLIVADQWRGDALGCLGNPAAVTPNIDRLAAQGVLFRRHFGQSAPCGPARASLLTGLYAMNHRQVANGTPLDARHTHLAREARRAGYEPMIIGYTTTTPDPRTVPSDDPRFLEMGDIMEGWRDWANFDETAFRNYFAWVERQGVALPADPLDLWGADDPRPGSSAAPARVPAHASDTAWSVAHALDFLRAQRRDRPWLLHLGFQRPHPPFAAPAPFHALVPDTALPPVIGGDPAEEAAQHPLMAHWFATQKRSGFWQGATGTVQPLGDEELRLTRRAYFGLVAEVDAAVGEVLRVLDAAGMADDTLVVFTSDHAEQLGDHGLLGKLGWFDQSYHVPLVIRAPGLPAGRVVEAFTEAVDVTPTILDWFGAEVPPQMDGLSLLPWLHGETPSAWRDAVHFEFDLRGGWPLASPPPLGLAPEECGMAAMRTARWKYVHFAALPPLLYDLERDPEERRNLAADPAHAALRLEAAEAMLRWRTTHLDRTLTHLCASPSGLVDRRVAFPA